MKSTTLALAASLLLGMPFSAAGWAQEGAAEAAAGVVDDAVAALNAADVDGYLVTLHSRFTGFGPRPEPYPRGDEYRRDLTDRIGRGFRTSIRLEDRTAQPVGDVVLVTGRLRGSVVPADGEVRSLDAWFTAVLAREGGGWKILHMHDSPVPRDAAGADAERTKMPEYDVTSPPASRGDFERWMTELSNWGRWGPDDELGALNLITQEKRRRAAALVQEGVAISLAGDMVRDTMADNARPMELEVRVLGDDAGFGGALDRYSLSYHGYYYSHLDGLAHISWKGRLYNGHSVAGITAEGASALGTEMIRDGLFTRAVLVDLPRFREVPYLEPGTAVTTDELEQWERWSGVRIEPGDVLLIRTGRWAARRAIGPWDATRRLAGLHVSTAPWLHARDVAAVGCDGVTDVLPSGVEGISQPLHALAIVAMGMPLFDNLNLERLAEAAAARGRWTFLFSVAPIRVPGGFGAPVNPMAVF